MKSDAKALQPGTHVWACVNEHKPWQCAHNENEGINFQKKQKEN